MKSAMRGASNRIRTAAGFTLLEVLVVLSVLGMVLLLLSQGLQFSLLSGRRLDGSARQTEAVVATDRLIRHLIEAADPGTGLDPAGFQGHPETLLLRTELPLAAGRETARRIVAALGVDQTHRLVLRWIPFQHAVRRGPPLKWNETVLLDGLERVEFRYWFPPREGAPAAWVTSVNAAMPPALIRMKLVFPEGSHRAWPEIAAAPRTERAAQ